MMDELIKQVSQRTGLAPDKARTAIDTVVGFLKEKLPAPIASQLDNALSGEEKGAGGMADKVRDLGGVFGK